jgi:hypothetical protein
MTLGKIVVGMRTISLCFAAFSFVSGMAAATSGADAADSNGALVLKDQGTFYVDGSIEFRSPIVRQR